MRRGPILSLALVCLILGLGACASARRQLCPHIRMEEGELKLSKNERILICGTGDGAVEGWREVPIPQAQYQIQVLLQNQGFLHPRFERDGNQLRVWSGPRERVTALEVQGAEGIVHAGRKRHVVGEPIGPAVLDDVKSWVDLQLREQGYGCAQSEVRAEAWAGGKIVVDVKPGPRMRIAGIDYQGLGDLDRESLARHQAMEPGNIYDVRETQLTAQRMLNDALFQSAYFRETCRGEEMDLALVTAIGRPRILRFGFGASTEEFPFTRVWFRNARLDDRASSLTASLYASPLRQSLDAAAEIYRLPFSRRTYFGPRFLLEHDKETAYEFNRAKLGADLGRQWDMWKTRMRARVGPTLNYVNTVRGVGPNDVAYVSWEGAYSIISRDYELFVRDQYSGWQADFEYRGQRVGVGSPINVDRYEVGLKKLWNLGLLSPPLLVLGTRAQAVAVNTNPVELSRDREALPVDYRVFMGGDENLRGFSRRSINNAELGYLTAAYLGTELRLIEELPYRLEPFLLYDIARLGDRRFTLDAPVYESKGLGLRWASPFGTLRGSAAKGRILKEDKSTESYRQEWMYFVSFGQEF